jgi:glycosyltransferase involved in cell wall biosynthesis
MKLISIVIPVFNAEKWISACLKSVLAQTYTFFEVICVNAGSKDESLQLLNSFVQRDRRISVISFPINQGVGAARNAGIKQAKGDYILSLDSDDYLSINSLQILFDTILKYDSEIVVGGVSLVNINNEELSKHSVKDIYVNITPIDHPELSIFSTGYHWSMLIKRELMFGNSIFYKEDCATSEDGYFLFSLIFNIKKMTIIPDIIYYYRQLENSASHSMRGFNYLYDDISAYKILYEKASISSMYKYANYRFSYRIEELFSYDLKYSCPHLSKKEQIKLFKMLIEFFKGYNVATSLKNLYLQRTIKTPPSKLFIPFLDALGEGNINLCAKIATKEYRYYKIKQFLKNSMKKYYQAY